MNSNYKTYNNKTDYLFGNVTLYYSVTNADILIRNVGTVLSVYRRD